MTQLVTHLQVDVAQMFIHPIPECVRLNFHPQVFIAADVHSLSCSAFGRSRDKTCLGDLLYICGSVSIMLQQSTMCYSCPFWQIHFCTILLIFCKTIFLRFFTNCSSSARFYFFTKRRRRKINLIKRFHQKRC